MREESTYGSGSVRVATGLMLGLVLLAAGAARAEVTPADEAGMRAFAECLEKTGNDEAACLKELGYYGWYPNDTDCEAVATLVHKAISDGVQTEWRDLFFNERCARLGLPHDREAAAAGDTNLETSEPSPEGTISRKIFVDCKGGKHWKNDVCFGTVGRYRWYDEDIYCATNRDVVKIAAENHEIQSWKLLFKNERCHRRGVWHYEPAR